MYVPVAKVRLIDRSVTLTAGDVIGRGRVSVRIEHPQISEAHALVSYREGSLWLLGLRGDLWLGTKPTDAIKLVNDVTVRLAEDVDLEVLSVFLPEKELLLRDTRGNSLTLPHEYVQVRATPLRVAEDDEDGGVELWWTDGRLHSARGPMTVGDTLVADGVELRVFERDYQSTSPTVRFRSTLELGGVLAKVTIKSGRDVVFTDVESDLLRAVHRLQSEQRGEPVIYERAFRLVWPHKDPRRSADVSGYYNALRAVNDRCKKAGAPDALVHPRRGYVAISVRYQVATVDM